MRDKKVDDLDKAIEDIKEGYKLFKEAVEEEFSEATKALDNLIKELMGSEDDLDDLDIYKEMADKAKMKKIQRKSNFNNQPIKNKNVNKNVSKILRRNQDR